jgi:pyridoxamine 5'-phosphate oxidase
MIDPAGAEDPFAAFASWMEAAQASEPNDANAVALATVDADGTPDVRMVLLKGVDTGGFVFYTNAQSAKGEQLSANQRAALVAHWKSLRRQVRARGLVEGVAEAEADAYFATRSRESQLGAWASEQSRPLESRQALEERVARYAAQHAGAVPRPPHWSGFRIKPLSIEFWSDRPARLHDRIVFQRSRLDQPWRRQRLYP